MDNVWKSEGPVQRQNGQQDRILVDGLEDAGGKDTKARSSKTQSLTESRARLVITKPCLYNTLHSNGKVPKMGV